MSQRKKVSHLTTAQLAHLFGWSEAHVLRLVNKEGLPTLKANSGRGGYKYNGPAVLKWYIQNKAKGVPQDDGDSLADNNIRIAKAKAERLERENAIERGRICYTDHVEQLGREAVGVLRAEVDSLQRLAHELAANTDANGVQVTLQEEGRRILARFADAFPESGKPPGGKKAGR